MPKFDVFPSQSHESYSDAYTDGMAVGRTLLDAFGKGPALQEKLKTLSDNAEILSPADASFISGIHSGTVDEARMIIEITREREAIA